MNRMIKKTVFRYSRVKKISYLIIINIVPVLYLYNKSMDVIELFIYLIFFNILTVTFFSIKAATWFVFDGLILEMFNPIRKKEKIILEDISHVEVESHVRTGNLLIVYLKNGKSLYCTTKVGLGKLKELKKLIDDCRYELFRNSQ